MTMMMLIIAYNVFYFVIIIYMPTTQKLYFYLNASDGQPIEWWRKRDIDVTLWWITNKVTVIVHDEPQEKVSKYWNTYYVWWQVIIPGLSSNVLLFYSHKYGYSNNKIWEWSNEISINLYRETQSFKSIRSGEVYNLNEVNYKIMFKYEEEDFKLPESSIETTFGNEQKENTETSKEKTSKSGNNYEDLPF